MAGGAAAVAASGKIAEIGELFPLPPPGGGGAGVSHRHRGESGDVAEAIGPGARFVPPIPRSPARTDFPYFPSGASPDGVRAA